jgi:cyclohexanone monooxygenase
MMAGRTSSLNPTFSAASIHFWGWISDTIAFVRAGAERSIEPSVETETAWNSHHEAVSEPTLLGQNRNSWRRLMDEDGRRRELLAYLGGIDHYRSVCDAFRASGYQGFDFA